jgi:hypothetical protein
MSLMTTGGGVLNKLGSDSFAKTTPTVKVITAATSAKVRLFMSTS